MRKFNYVVLGQSSKMGFITTTALVMGGLSALAIGAGTAAVLSQKRKAAAPAAAPTPATPSTESIQAAAKEKAAATSLQKRRARTKTVRTGPRGILTQARTEKKGLLGE